MGKHLLIATTLDESGYTVSAVLSLGQTQAEWEASPLWALNEITFTLEKVGYLCLLPS